MIEEILKDALQQVDGLAGKVYKLAAPKEATAPYAVFGKHDDTELQDLDGGTGFWTGNLELHLLAANYAALKALEQGVKRACRTAEGKVTADGLEVCEMRARVAETEEALPNTKLEHSEMEVTASWLET